MSDSSDTQSIEEVFTSLEKGKGLVAINGVVYDLSKYDDHPGGFESLEECFGEDATYEFEGIGHSRTAIEQMSKFRVGSYQPDKTGEEDNGSSLKLENGEDKNKLANPASAKTSLDAPKGWFGNHGFKYYWLGIFTIPLMAILVNLGTIPAIPMPDAHYPNATGMGGRFQIVGYDHPGYPGAQYVFKLEYPEWYDLWVPWMLYACHQIPVWYLIYVADKEVTQPGQKKFTRHFRWFNWRMLIVNLIGVVVKMIHTHFFYNGLSASLPLWFGIGTVFVYLGVVIMMYVPTRGFIFGYGKNNKSVNTLSRWCRKYHSYYFAFAVVNDFWYHPMESSVGHLAGMLIDSALLWQCITIFTFDHRNKYWCWAIEILIVPHSFLIALNRVGPDPAAFQFGVGFSLLVFLNSIHGLDLSKLFRTLCFLMYAVLVGAAMWGNFFNAAPGDLFVVVLQRGPPLLMYGLQLWFIIAWLTLGRVCGWLHTNYSKNYNPIVKGVCLVTYLGVLAVSFSPFFLIFGGGDR